jgi:hypothetical protein
MAKAAADLAAFERRLREQLEARLGGRGRFSAHENDGVWVEEIRLDGSYPHTTGAIMLRDDQWVPDTGWDRVDRSVGEQTFVMWELKHTPEAPFHVWPNLNPVRTFGATYDGFALYAQTD